LALGTGATTAVFSVIYAALLNPYPFLRVPAASCAWRSGYKTGNVELINSNPDQIRHMRQMNVIESVSARHDRGERGCFLRPDLAGLSERGLNDALHVDGIADAVAVQIAGTAGDQAQGSIDLHLNVKHVHHAVVVEIASCRLA
jgi:hypothetical protein